MEMLKKLLVAVLAVGFGVADVSAAKKPTQFNPDDYELNGKGSWVEKKHNGKSADVESSSSSGDEYVQSNELEEESDKEAEISDEEILAVLRDADSKDLLTKAVSLLQVVENFEIPYCQGITAGQTLGAVALCQIGKCINYGLWICADAKSACPPPLLANGLYVVGAAYGMYTLGKLGLRAVKVCKDAKYNYNKRRLKNAIAKAETAPDCADNPQRLERLKRELALLKKQQEQARRKAAGSRLVGKSGVQLRVRPDAQ